MHRILRRWITADDYPAAFSRARHAQASAPSYRKQASAILSSAPSCAAIGDRADARRRHELHVFGQHATRVPWRRRLPARATPREFRVAHVELDEQLVGIDRDRIAFLDQSDVSADVRLGSHVTHDHAPGATGETPIGYETHRLAQPLPDQRRGRSEHFLHAGTPFGPFIAADDHVARLHLLGYDRLG